MSELQGAARKISVAGELLALCCLHAVPTTKHGSALCYIHTLQPHPRSAGKGARGAAASGGQLRRHASRARPPQLPAVCGPSAPAGPSLSSGRYRRPAPRPPRPVEIGTPPPSSRNLCHPAHLIPSYLSGLPTAYLRTCRSGSVHGAQRRSSSAALMHGGGAQALSGVRREEMERDGKSERERETERGRGGERGGEGGREKGERERERWREGEQR